MPTKEQARIQGRSFSLARFDWPGSPRNAGPKLGPYRLLIWELIKENYDFFKGEIGQDV